jgi:competence protein ComEC
MAWITHDREIEEGPHHRGTVAIGRPFTHSLAFLRDGFVAERARWALWIPVFIGIGIAAYFRLPIEPEIWLGPVILVVSLTIAGSQRRQPALLIPTCILCLATLGFSAAQLRTALVDAPVLDRKLGPVGISGDVARVETRPQGARLWIDRPIIDRLDRTKTPRKIRIRLSGAALGLQPGDRIKLLAVLHPPSGPAAPGAFDFARRAYFLQLGAVGYAVRSPVLLRKASATGFSIRLAALRQHLTETIHVALPGRTGTVAAALMTGERSAIPDDVLTAMRESGLAHLLAISGLHIGLVAGLLFFALRLCLALWEKGALRFPIKKWAAIAALLGSFVYLLISGMTLPTQRAFLMLCFVMLAIVIDRSAISMNLVAWAAAVILLIQPESLMSVSFQMSFAAVAALVAVYEHNVVARMIHPQANIFVRTARYFSAVLLTTLVAGFATAPFALYHFNQVALYGVLANLLAVPLTALWIMPFAILGFLLMPMGLESMALVPMGWGIDGVISIAKLVQGLPGAVASIPAMPPVALGLVVAGGLWLCLWRTSWRSLGVPFVVIGLSLITTAETPDILVSDTGKVVAIKHAGGGLAFRSPPRGFVAETWLRREGIKLSSKQEPGLSIANMSNSRCDDLGCIVRMKNHVIALVQDVAGLADDCPRATIVISRVPIKRRYCSRPARIIDRFSLWQHGAHALWLTDGAARVENVATMSGRRPWNRYAHRTRKISSDGSAP